MGGRRKKELTAACVPEEEPKHRVQKKRSLQGNLVRGKGGKGESKRTRENH